MPSPLSLTKTQLDILDSIDDKLESALSAGVSDGFSLIFQPMDKYSDDQSMGGGDAAQAKKTRDGIKNFLKLGLAALISQLEESPATQISSGKTSGMVLVRNSSGNT